MVVTLYYIHPIFHTRSTQNSVLLNLAIIINDIKCITNVTKTIVSRFVVVINAVVYVWWFDGFSSPNQPTQSIIMQ